MRRVLLAMLPLLAVLSLLIAALWLAADAESAQSQLGRAYAWLLFLAAGGVLAFETFAEPPELERAPCTEHTPEVIDGF